MHRIAVIAVAAAVALSAVAAAAAGEAPTTPAPATASSRCSRSRTSRTRCRGATQRPPARSQRRSATARLRGTAGSTGPTTSRSAAARASVLLRDPSLLRVAARAFTALRRTLLLRVDGSPRRTAARLLPQFDLGRRGRYQLGGVAADRHSEEYHVDLLRRLAARHPEPVWRDTCRRSAQGLR